MSRPMLPGLLLAGILALAPLGALSLPVSAAAASSASATCQSAGTTGLTAKIVAQNGQTIQNQAVDAAGCDVGIFVGPGANHVTIAGVTVTSANDHGIFVQDASGVTIKDSVVENNGLNPHLCPKPTSQNCIQEDKAIELVGTDHALVAGNDVYNNQADGGIGVADDGQVDAGAPKPGNPKGAYANVIEGNASVDNQKGCGIVFAAYDPGPGLKDNVAKDNVVVGNPAGIIVAADSPLSKVVNTDVTGNLAEKNFLPGIIVHSNTPGDAVEGTVIENNVLVANGGFPAAAGNHGPKTPTGIIVIGEPLAPIPGLPPGTAAPKVGSTTIKGNAFQNETTNVVFAFPPKSQG